jgi:hypothetical protein
MEACSINPRSRRGALASLVTAALLAVTAAAAGLPIAGSLALAVVTFEDVNPNNSDLDPTDPDGATGGRVNGVASVPGDNQTFYAASEWGGLYKSTDAGQNWVRLDRHLPVATWRVKVDPSNTSIVYATSFYDGRVTPLSGIQVSRDAGATWTHPLTSTPDPAFACALSRRTEPSAFGIGIRPDATNNVFIGTNCGVAISNDSGATWRFVDPTPLATASNVWDVVVQAGGANGIVDICGDDGHLRSVDGGTTWTPGGGLLPAGRCSIAVSPDEAYVLFVAAADNNLYESNDAGATWTALGNPTPQGRIPFVVTNNRAGTAFDMWFGDVSLFRAGCTTPAVPAPGGADRCPLSGAWAGPFTRTAGAHDDAGLLVFDTAVAVDSCPRIFSSDGGVYRNTTVVSPACHTPTWEQPTVTPHGLWLFTMAGANRATDAAEDLYFGNQDNGSFGTITGGAALPTWHNQDCCDVFDMVPDANRVVYTVCCFSPAPALRMFVRAPGLGAGGEIPNYPPGNLIGFKYPDGIARFGDRMYAVVTTSGVFFTLDITVGAIVWTQFGAATSPASPCAIWSSVDAGTPVFYVMAGANGCDPRLGNQVWTFVGTGAGSWTQIDNNDGLTGGFGIFTVDPTNANRLYASHLPPTGPEMVFSNDAGINWENNTELDDFMDGGGFFRASNTNGPTDFTGFGGYPQPTLVAFDPEDPTLVVAGGADSGVFLSTNGGLNWFLLTDPFDSDISGVPHLPRPRFAYFDHEPAGTIKLYVGTQGRGVWRITLSNQPPDAICQNVTVNTDPGVCTAASASVDNGSFDPDGDPITLVQVPPAPYGKGTTNVTLTVTDNQGASDSCTATVTVLDREPPALTCSAPQVVECTGSGSAVATYSATATDNCGFASTSCVPPSGSSFPLGTTAVTCNAVDDSKNSSSCSSSVTVVDTTKPVVSCVESVNPSGKNVPKASNTNEDGFYKVSASDICTTPVIKIGSFTLASGETIKITQTPGKSGVRLVNTMGKPAIKHFQVGPNDAVITATDGSGNQASVTCFVPPPPK